MTLVRSLTPVLLMVVALSACRQARSPASEPPAATAVASEHEHEAPHKGTLVELGEEFAHLELVRDPAAGTLTAYVLDGEVERPIRLSQAAIGLRLEAPAARYLDLVGRGNALTGEKPGDTSEFVAADDVFKGPGPSKGVVVAVTVRGNTFKDVPFVLTQ
jgi:hypothetical protein